MNTGSTQSMYFAPNSSLVTENNKLRLELEELQNQIQILRGQPSDHASLHSKISSLNQENRNLINERSALLTQIAQLKGTADRSPQVNMNELRNQVELLLQENDRLSQALKNYKEKSSFMDQSREFRGGDSMSKGGSGDLEAKLAMLTEENDRLNAVINEREEEIEHLKSKLLPVDSMQITLLEHENTIVVLSTENEKLRVMLNDREREIETFKMRNNSYSMDQSSIIHEQHELKERCEMLASELERIHHEYTDKNKEVQDLKEYIKAIGGNPRASASLELQNERFSVERQGYENQLDQLKQEKDQFRLHVEDLEIRNEALEGNLEKLIEEKESLRAEIDLWKSKYNVLNENHPEVERNAPHLSILREENNQIRALIIEQNAQITTLKEQIEELDVTLAGKEGVIREADKKFKMLLAENERVNKILVQKKKEIEGLQSKMSKGKGLEEKIAMLVMENQNVVANLHEQQRENEHLRSNLQSLQEINSPRGDILTLEEENTRLHYQDQENMRTIQILKEKLTHQESRIAEKSQELHQSNIHKMTVEVAEQKCKDLEAKISVFMKENEDLVVALLQREKEAEGLKRELFQYRSVGSSLGDLHTRVQQLVSENEELAAELEEKCEECETWKARVKSLEDRTHKASELENKIQTMQSENLKISTVLRNQEDEHEDLKQSYAQLQRELNKTSKQEKVLENLQDENDHLTEELQETKRELEVFRKKLEKYSEMSAKVKELEVNLEIQKSEYDALLETIRGREEDVKMWRDKAETLENRIGNYEELEEKELLLKQDLEELKEILRIKSMEVQAVDDQRVEIERLRERIRFLLMQKVLANALNESLRASLDDLSEKNTAFQGKFNAVKDVYLQELKRVADKLDDVERNNDILRQEVANKEEETALAREKYSSIQRVESFIGEFEERVRLLGEENESLAGDLKHRTADIEKLRKIISENEREKSELRTKVLEFESMEKSNTQDLHEKRIENEKLSRQIKDNQREIEKWKTKSLEFENSHKRLVDLEERCRDLNTEKGRLNVQIEEKEYEIGTWKDKCNTMEKRGNNRAVQLDRKVEVLETEVERLNNLIVEYDREGERYRNRITDLENKNNLYNSQMEGQRESIKFSAQSSILKKTVRSPFAEFKEKIEDVQSNSDLQEENAKLARELNQKAFEFEKLRGQYETLEQNLVERIRELDEEVSRLTEKNEALNNLLALQDEETESPNKMGIVLRELEAQIDDLKQENEELRERQLNDNDSNNGMNGESHHHHHANIQELEKRIKDLQEENQILIETYRVIAKGEEKKNTSSNRSRLSNQSLETFQLQEKLIQAVSANEKLSQENLELRRRHQNVPHHQVFEDKENKRFSEIADESTKEVEKLKAQVKGLQMSLSQYKSFKERVEMLERENQRLSAGARDTYNSSDQRIHFSLHQARDSIREEDSDKNLINHVLLCSEIERLHLILFEINDTHQEQIEKVNVEWEKLVDAYTMRMRELERDNEELRIRMAGEEEEEYEMEEQEA